MNDAIYGCDGCRGTLGARGCPTHNGSRPVGANIYVTHCLHGMDLRLYPRCFLCRPLSATEMDNWLRSQNVPRQEGAA